LFDDTEGYFLTNQPLDPGKWGEEEIHNRPKHTTMNSVANHCRQHTKDGIDQTIPATIQTYFITHIISLLMLILYPIAGTLSRFIYNIPVSTAQRSIHYRSDVA
jgi:hypothetical protein